MNPAAPTRPAKDAEPARQRLLLAGLRLFAEQGFAKTSTRELAEAAGVNVASISYYFGDKAGLYRAVFLEPTATPPGALEALLDPALPLRDALAGFFAAFMAPLREGDMARLCIKLHFREMLEPTGLWAEAIAADIQPMHDTLLALLQRHLGLAAPDEDLQRLVVSISALGVHQHVGRDVTDTVAPGLYEGEGALDRWTERLVMYAEAMVRAEAARRAGPENER